MKKTTYQAIGLLVVTLVFHVILVIYTALFGKGKQVYVYLDNTVSTTFEPFTGIETLADSALLDSVYVKFVVNVHMSERPDGQPYATYPKGLVEFVRQGPKIICRLSADGRKAFTEGKKMKRSAGNEKSTDTLSVDVYVDRSFGRIVTDPKHLFVLSGVHLDSLSLYAVHPDFDIFLTDSCDIGKFNIDYRRRDKEYHSIYGDLGITGGSSVGDMLVNVHNDKINLSCGDCRVGTLYVSGDGGLTNIVPDKFGHICLRPEKGGMLSAGVTEITDDWDLK